MNVLEGKAAIVTGSARGIGRATAELLCAHGARVLVNDLDADLAAAGRRGDRGRHGRLRRRPHAGGRLRGPRREGGRRVRPARHRREQRRVHVGRDRAQDVRRAVPGDARDPYRRPLPRPPRRLPYLREPAKKEREEGREVFRKVVNVTSISGTQGNVGQVNYSAGKAAPRRHHEDARAGNGARSR